MINFVNRNILINFMNNVILLCFVTLLYSSRGEFSRLVMRCVKWDGYITRFLGMLGLESLFMKEER
jgi:hypothetical protein